VYFITAAPDGDTVTDNFQPASMSSSSPASLLPLSVSAAEEVPDGSVMQLVRLLQEKLVFPQVEEYPGVRANLTVCRWFNPARMLEFRLQNQSFRFTVSVKHRYSLTGRVYNGVNLDKKSFFQIEVWSTDTPHLNLNKGNLPPAVFMDQIVTQIEELFRTYWKFGTVTEIKTCDYAKGQMWIYNTCILISQQNNIIKTSTVTSTSTIIS
jgi:hypothetical protein